MHRRRQSQDACALAPSSVVPQMADPSHILTDAQVQLLAGSSLPGHLAFGTWKLAYSTHRDGYSLHTLYRKAAGLPHTVLVVQDSGEGAIECEPRGAWLLVRGTLSPPGGDPGWCVWILKASHCFCPTHAHVLRGQHLWSLCLGAMEGLPSVLRHWRDVRCEHAAATESKAARARAGPRVEGFPWGRPSRSHSSSSGPLPAPRSVPGTPSAADLAVAARRQQVGLLFPVQHQ
jgi:hypothetical protein